MTTTSEASYMTKDQVKSFQSISTDHLGKPLLVDGDWGPKTEWAWCLAHQSEDRKAVVGRAISAIGIAEIAPNRGPEIDEWLRRCGLDPEKAAYPWCAAFASWCLSAPGCKPVALARVADLVQAYPRVTYDLALPGDLGYILRSDGTGHVWVLSGFGTDQERSTMQVEGNNGNAVRCTTRTAGGASGYLQTFPTFRPNIPPGVLPADGGTR